MPIRDAWLLAPRASSFVNDLLTKSSQSAVHNMMLNTVLSALSLAGTRQILSSKVTCICKSIASDCASALDRIKKWAMAKYSLVILISEQRIGKSVLVPIYEAKSCSIIPQFNHCAEIVYPGTNCWILLPSLLGLLYPVVVWQVNPEEQYCPCQTANEQNNSDSEEQVFLAAEGIRGHEITLPAIQAGSDDEIYPDQ
jgi:hypothetical protein